MRKQLLFITMSLGLLIAFGANKAQAQIVGEIEADVPFQFYAGNVELPAGRYTIKIVNNYDPKLVQISSADGRAMAMVRVIETRAITPPTQTVLIFNRYGNRYFLSKLFGDGNEYGSEVMKSQYERELQKGMIGGEIDRVPGHRRTPHQKN